MDNDLVNRFKEGQIIIFPTDTLYAIGCKISDDNAISRLYQIKEREESKPSLILAADLETAKKYAAFSQTDLKFLNLFWPGPLTAVAKATKMVPESIRGENNTIGIRVPNFPRLLAVLKQLNEAVLAPSANFQGQKPPASFQQIDKELLSLVDYFLDLKYFKPSYKMLGKASTIVDLTQKPYKILRLGSIDSQKIRNAENLLLAGG